MKKIRSPFYNKKFLTFHQNVIEELWKEEMIRFCFIKAEGKLIAGIYLLLYNNNVYYYQSGFDPAWRKLSPGTLLFYYCIRSSYENKKEEFDFLRGDEEYKYYWTGDKKYNIKITAYNNTQRGRFSYRIYNRIGRLKSFLAIHEPCE